MLPLIRKNNQAFLANRVIQARFRKIKNRSKPERKPSLFFFLLSGLSLSLIFVLCFGFASKQNISHDSSRFVFFLLSSLCVHLLSLFFVMKKFAYDNMSGYDETVELEAPIVSSYASFIWMAFIILLFKI